MKFKNLFLQIQNSIQISQEKQQNSTLTNSIINETNKHVLSNLKYLKNLSFYFEEIEPTKSVKFEQTNETNQISQILQINQNQSNLLLNYLNSLNLQNMTNVEKSIEIYYSELLFLLNSLKLILIATIDKSIPNAIKRIYQFHLNELLKVKINKR